MEINPEAKQYTLTGEKYSLTIKTVLLFVLVMKMDVSTTLFCWPWPGLYSFSYNSAQFSGKRKKNGKPQRLLSLLTTLAFPFAYSYLPMLWYNSNPCTPLKGKQFPGLVVGFNTNPLGSIHSLAHLQWRPV